VGGKRRKAKKVRAAGLKTKGRGETKPPGDGTGEVPRTKTQIVGPWDKGIDPGRKGWGGRVHHGGMWYEDDRQNNTKNVGGVGGCQTGFLGKPARTWVLVG